MEQNEISYHEASVFRAFVTNPGRWLSNKNIADLIEGVQPRTVRAKTIKLTRMGILDCAEVFPGHRYRLAEKAQKRNGGYWDRLVNAAEVLGIVLS